MKQDSNEQRFMETAQEEVAQETVARGVGDAIRALFQARKSCDPTSIETHLGNVAIAMQERNNFLSS